MNTTPDQAHAPADGAAPLKRRSNLEPAVREESDDSPEPTSELRGGLTTLARARQGWRRGTAWLVAALFCGLVAGCGGGSGDPAAAGGSTGGAGASTGVYTLEVDAAPLNASITLDSSREVSASFTLAGGSLSVTAADGVSYRLDIPATALATPVTVTMTPLASATGLPAGESAYGVQLGPEGLQFLSPVTLTVTPAPDMTWPVAQQVPLSLTGSDNIVSLTDLVTTSALPVFPLLHFSSYVVLLSEKGFDASVKDVRKRLGGNEEQRLQSAIAEKVAKERQAQLQGNAPALEALNQALNAMFAEIDERVVKPRLAAAGSSCAAGQLARDTVLGFARQRQLVGGAADPRVADVLSGSVADLISEVCFREEYEICRDEHIVTRMMPAFLRAARQEQLAGASTANVKSVRLQKAEEYVRKCLQFEVQFDTDMTYDQDYPDHVVRESMSGRLKLGYVLDLTQLPADVPSAIGQSLALIGSPGFVPLRSLSYDVDYPERCATVNSTQRVGVLMGASFLGLEPGQNTPQTPGGANTVKDFKLSLAFDASSMGSNFNVSSLRLNSNGGCDGPPAVTNEYESFVTELAPLWLASIDTADSGAVVQGWQSNGNADIMATKDQALDFSAQSGQRARGNVHLVMFHTPIR